MNPIHVFPHHLSPPAHVCSCSSSSLSLSFYSPPPPPPRCPRFTLLGGGMNFSGSSFIIRPYYRGLTDSLSLLPWAYWFVVPITAGLLIRCEVQRYWFVAAGLLVRREVRHVQNRSLLIRLEIRPHANMRRLLAKQKKSFFLLLSIFI